MYTSARPAAQARAVTHRGIVRLVVRDYARMDREYPAAGRSARSADESVPLLTADAWLNTRLAGDVLGWSTSGSASAVADRLDVTALEDAFAEL